MGLLYSLRLWIEVVDRWNPLWVSIGILPSRPAFAGIALENRLKVRILGSGAPEVKTKKAPQGHAFVSRYVAGGSVESGDDGAIVTRVP
jgi:hypothetical protein